MNNIPNESVPTPSPPARTPLKGFLREMALTLVLALAVYLLLHSTIESSIVNNISMQPGLIAGQRLIINKVIYNFREPQRGEIIILYPPVQPDEQWVKRLIGLPGDIIEVKNHQLYVNHIPLVEPYIKEAPIYTYGPFQVPAGHYFVMGDNRNNSMDSHYNWTVSHDKIVGKAWLRIWPLSFFGGVGNYPIDPQLSISTFN